MVSLPHDWVNQMNLKRGDTVNLTSDDQGRLIIHPSAEMLKTRTRCIVHSDKVDAKLLGRLILGAYIAGHETIEVRTNSPEFPPEFVSVIRKTMNELIGVGIVSQDVNRIVIQSFLDPSKFPIDGLISRLHLIVESMRDLAVKALVDGSQVIIEEILCWPPIRNLCLSDCVAYLEIIIHCVIVH